MKYAIEYRNAEGRHMLLPFDLKSRTVGDPVPFSGNYVTFDEKCLQYFTSYYSGPKIKNPTPSQWVQRLFAIADHTTPWSREWSSVGVVNTHFDNWVAGQVEWS